MSSERIPLQDPVAAEDAARIDAFGASYRGLGALSDLAAFLRRELGCAVTDDPDIVAGFARDSSNLPGEAGALARPATMREAAAVLRACARAGIPVTVSAGRSNLTGSATPQGGLVLATADLETTGVTVDAAQRTASAPVGKIVETFRQEVLRRSEGRLAFPVDPTSRRDATVGGAIACNASGFTPGETGATRHWVEALDLLLPDGLLLRAERGQYVSRDGAFQLVRPDGAVVAWPVPRYGRPAIKNASGPWSAPDGAMDLIDLIVGGEGIFGLVTACRKTASHSAAASSKDCPCSGTCRFTPTGSSPRNRRSA